MTAEEIVDRQLIAYNAHDLEGFLAFYSEDIELFNLGEKLPYVSNIRDLRQVYRERFENVNLAATIKNRIVKNECVIDQESVSGIGESPVAVVAIYRLENLKIRSVWFIRDR